VIAVTGATGMLGSHIVAALEFSGFNIISVSRSESESKSCRHWDLNQWKTEEEFDELFKGVDAIIHAGAAVPSAKQTFSEQELFDVNVRASLNLAEWAKKRNIPMIYISGAIVYQDPEEKDILEDAPLGWSGLGGFYGMTKLLAENLLQQEKNAGLDLAIIRPSSIYGYGLSSDKLICSFLEKANQGQTIELEEPINDSVDLIHAADVAAAIVEILKKCSWNIFNIASGKLTSVDEIARISLLTVKNGKVSVKKSIHSVQPKLSRFALKCKLAEMQLGWVPKINISTGMQSVFEQKVLVVGQ
jgi:nucleoside-diphosphate-sugar epimerase